MHASGEQTEACKRLTRLLLPGDINSLFRRFLGIADQGHVLGNKKAAQSADSLLRFGLANRKNSARSPWYLASGRLFSRPPNRVLPDRSKTRQSHLLPRFATSISNIKSWSKINQFSSRGQRFFGALATSPAYPRRNDGTGRYMPTKSGRAIFRIGRLLGRLHTLVRVRFEVRVQYLL